MAEKALAATLVAPKEFEVREYLLPEEIPNDAGILRMEAAGICGSDVHGYQRAGHPRIMGHENVGIVVKIGREASRRWGVKEGDRVALEEYVPCGGCKWCHSDLFRFCDQTDSGGRGEGPRLWYGATPVTVWPSLWGGYSQYLYLHPGAVVHKMPNHIPAHEAALFLALSNGVEWACRYGGAGLGDTVLIQGPGQMGLAGAFAAKVAGAACIIVSGLSIDARRLEVAKRLGADYIIDVEKENFRERVMEITGGEGVHVVVNASGGGKGCIADSIAVASKRCTIVFGAAGNEPFTLASAGRKEIVIKSAHGHSYSSIEQGIQFLAAGNFPQLKGLSTHRFSLTKVREAIDTVARQGAPDAIHVCVMPWD